MAKAAAKKKTTTKKAATKSENITVKQAKEIRNEIDEIKQEIGELKKGGDSESAGRLERLEKSMASLQNLLTDDKPAKVRRSDDDDDDDEIDEDFDWDG